MRQQAQPRAPQRRVVGHDQDVGEEAVDRRPERRQLAQRSAVVAASAVAASTRGIRCLQLVEQLRLGRLASASPQSRSRSNGGRVLQLACDVLDALERRRQLSELRRCRRTPAAPRASPPDVERRRRSSGRADTTARISPVANPRCSSRCCSRSARKPELHRLRSRRCPSSCWNASAACREQRRQSDGALPMPVSSGRSTRILTTP